LKASNLKLQI